MEVNEVIVKIIEEKKVLLEEIIKLQYLRFQEEEDINVIYQWLFKE